MKENGLAAEKVTISMTLHKHINAQDKQY